MEGTENVNDDAAPFNIFDAAKESGTLVEESTEQQGEETKAETETVNLIM